MRPSWDKYFMSIATEVAKRSTCVRRQVGAVIVRDKRILTTGYNGAPRGIKHCADRGCLREELNIPSGERHELCRGAHAESNALVQAAMHGVGIIGATLYCTNQPCSFCAKMLINAGIKHVFIDEGYPDELAEELFAEAGVVTETWWLTDSTPARFEECDECKKKPGSPVLCPTCLSRRKALGRSKPTGTR